jgi:hypothetical protein
MQWEGVSNESWALVLIVRMHFKRLKWPSQQGFFLISLSGVFFKPASQLIHKHNEILRFYKSVSNLVFIVLWLSPQSSAAQKLACNKIYNIQIQPININYSLHDHPKFKNMQRIMLMHQHHSTTLYIQEGCLLCMTLNKSLVIFYYYTNITITLWCDVWWVIVDVTVCTDEFMVTDRPWSTNQVPFFHH